MASPSSSPMLPPELEREIFERCALSWPTSVPKLMLVTKCVKEWVEPLLYRIIALAQYGPVTGIPCFTDDVISTAIRQKPPTFFHGAVRHLMLITHDASDVDYETVLSVCGGLEDLWFLNLDNVEDAWIPLIECLPLRRLCAPSGLCSMLSPASGVFSRLTHLYLRDQIQDAELSVAALIALPTLSHLALDDHTFVHQCHKILELPRPISVLIFMRYYPADWEGQEVVARLAQDMRFVLMNLRNFAKDWQLGAQFGNDYWSAAETFIAKRRSREIDPATYFMIHDPDEDNTEA
ncbi:hypothetical protein MVEN_00278200 [Mycena venus]|uniref:Uncharacterized protein n=1 Tax=Mycena venus TaxID=2733690 RepID=A0A8H6Z578_9AGAR|nr:hypothetical protein MVEN_00278200 [Mycena venus]